MEGGFCCPLPSFYDKIATIIIKVKDQEIEKIKLVLTISLKNHYDRIVAIVMNITIRDQEEKNIILAIY